MQYGAPHVPQNDYSNNDLHVYKYGHSMSLKSHNMQVADVVLPRSSWTIANRGASYPALPVDTTVEMVQETIGRRVIHSRLMSANNGMGTFRRDARPESTSDYFAQKHIVKDFLNTMHEVC